jgi:hypothetical protein
MGVEKSLFAAQKSFFDNSSVRLTCKSKTRHSGSNSWIFGRYAYLTNESEKILIRAQSLLFHLLAVFSSRKTVCFPQSNLANSLSC